LTGAVATGLAVLAMLLQVLLAALVVVAVAALFAPAARRLLVEAREMLLGGELWVAAAIALVAAFGSMYFSEVAHFVPCRLCWFQRIAMYPLAVLLPLAAWRRDVRGGPLYALPMAVIGAGVSVYHIYIELNPAAESAGCRVGAPCSVKWIDEFGFVTLPVLALTAFLAIGALALMALSRSGGGRRRPAA
jgi:disulfide bond formation protein DsbB